MKKVEGSASARRVRGFIREQGTVLGATLQAARDLPRILHGPAEPVRVVVLVGSGSSKNALVATAEAFQVAHRCPVLVEGPLELLRYVRRGGFVGSAAAETLAVVVSQSGSSTTTLEALEAAQDGGFRTLALTAEPDSPFGRAAAERVVLPIGREDIGPKTKGFTATEAMLVGVAEATAAGAGRHRSSLPDPQRFQSWFDASLPGWERIGEELASRYAKADHVMVIGAGRHFGTALEGSLKIQEMAGMRASAFDLEDALHGRFHGLGARSLVIPLVGEPDDEQMAIAAANVLSELGVAVEVLSTVDLQEHGTQGDGAGHEGAADEGAADDGAARVTSVGRFAGDRYLDVLGAVVPFQVFAERAAHELGVDPDAMRYPEMSSRLGIKLTRP